MVENSSFSFNPIGYVRCPQKYRYEAPRQGVFAANEGFIELEPRHDYETAVRDLDSFDRIWVVFVFHLNTNWKPTVRPPVSGAKEKVGVFASRSPHRPNPIGMSCVELERIEGRNVYIRNFDILDGTPVLDLKPYIVKADCFPEASTGWLPERLPQEWQVKFNAEAETQMAFIMGNSGLDLRNFSEVQLHNSPLHKSRKRVAKEDNGEYSISCRTWRIYFLPDPENFSVDILRVGSNYSEDDLIPGAEDIYHDKDLHRAFLTAFPPSR